MKDEVQFVAQDIASLGAVSETILLSWFRAAARFKAADERNWLLSLAESNYATDKNPEQFWRTVIWNQVEGRAPAPKEYGDHFEAFVFDAILNGEAANDDWWYKYAAAVEFAIAKRIRVAGHNECDDRITYAIRSVRQLQQQGHIIECPEWTIPEKWITLNEEKKYTLRPPGDPNVILRDVAIRGFGSFFITKAGRMGRGSPHLQTGDQIAIVNGSDQVFSLRKAAENFRLIGERYVHGLMRHERQGEVTAEQRITLI